MKLRYIAIAVVLVLGCRKDGKTGGGGGSAGGGSGSGSGVTADAATAPVPDAAAAPVPDAAAAPVPDAAAAPVPDAAAPAADAPAPRKPAAQGEPCPDGTPCETGLSCVKYFGIAGPRGGEFTSCEIRCGGGGACPGGQKCVTIADGPGQVCRPSR